MGGSGRLTPWAHTHNDDQGYKNRYIMMCHDYSECEGSYPVFLHEETNPVICVFLIQFNVQHDN